MPHLNTLVKVLYQGAKPNIPCEISAIGPRLVLELYFIVEIVDDFQNFTSHRPQNQILVEYRDFCPS